MEPQFSRKLVVPCRHGLHMRSAARIVELAVTFDADVQFTSGSRTANAKSMIGLMELGAIQGETLVLTTRGKDAEKMIEAISALFHDEAGLCRALPHEDEPAGEDE